ncbi:DUF1173 family protein [Nocardia jiangxiensis]|uniref:DUF1173 family protein n=1 Tax=Nocardia jiangxiensis TaxID=282685 RepID=A0ABW6S265_9NOCA
MMYSLDGQTLDLRGEAGQQVLADIHRDPSRRPGCLCNPSEDGGVPMYVARIGDRYYLKRMPGSGPEHTPDCGSWSPPAELSGLAPLLGTAIRDNPDTGTTRLGLGFALTRHPGRDTSTDSADRENTDGGQTRLSLRSLLHYLWEESGLTRWTPALAGKRNWGMVRSRIQRAADDKIIINRKPLTEYLYLPETFSSTHKPEIAARRAVALQRLTDTSANTKLMLLIGEVKDLRPARFGRNAVIVKHLPDFPILADETLATHLHTRFSTEFTLRQAICDSHLILAGTFSLSSAGVAVAHEAALMTVTRDWIPFDTTSDHALLGTLDQQRRRYVKSLRYLVPAAEPVACVILTDTDPPTPCYLIDDQQNQVPEVQGPQWIWNTSTDICMPPLPPPASGIPRPTVIRANSSVARHRDASCDTAGPEYA